MNISKPRKSTIRDVANATHLSIGAVSQILSGKRKGRPQNVAKINKAIKKLNYRRNITARSLASGKTKTIGIVFFCDSELAHASLLQWVEYYCQKAGYDIIPNNLYLNGDTDVDSLYPERDLEVLFDNLINRRVDGIISEGSLVSSKTATILIQEGVKLSIWEPETAMPEEVSVTRADWPKIMDLAVEHLCNLNHKKIHLLAGFDKYITAREEAVAFKQSLIKHNIRDSEAITYSNTMDSCEFGYHFIKDIYCKNPHEITGLVCADDSTAMGVISACYQLGIKIPEQLSVIGVNDVFYAQHACPPLTTVYIDFKHTAERLCNSLLDSMETGVGSVEQCLCKLVVRKSTSAPPRQDRL